MERFLPAVPRSRILPSLTTTALALALVPSAALAQSIPIQDSQIFTAPAGTVPASANGGPTTNGEISIVRERFFEETPPTVAGSGVSLTPTDPNRDGRYAASILVRNGPVVDNSRNPETEATITFPVGVTVIGIVDSTGELLATDSSFGLSPAINYTADSRGMEGGEFLLPDPFFVVNGDGTTEIRFRTNMNASPFTDEFRVLVDYGDSFTSNAQMRVDTIVADDINVGATATGNAAPASNIFVPLTLDAPCYIASNTSDALTVFSRGDNSQSAVGTGFGVTDVFAMAFDPVLGRLVGTSGNLFGRIDRSTGTFAAIGTMGTITRGATTLTVDNVQGLAFDPNSGDLYGVLRRTAPVLDVLFMIDPATGLPIAGAFGGEDFVDIELNAGKDDVDDIAIDPLTGTLYGLSATGASETRLMTIDFSDGTVEDLGEVTGGHDVQGLAFDTDGNLHGSTAGGRYLAIDKSDGATTLSIALPVGGDHEAIECLLAAPNTLTGTVFQDDDFDGVLDGGEGGTANVAVDLYRDNGNGTFSASEDTFLATALTDGTGAFTHRTVSVGTFFTVVNTATLPAGHALTTAAEGTATFTDFGSAADVGDFGEVATADLALDLVPSNATPIVGDLITLTLSLTNSGPGDATGVVVNFPLPSDLALVSDNSGGAYNGTDWSAGTIATGTTDLILSVRVVDSDAFAVTADVSASNEYDPNSIVGNANPFEDDYATLSFSVAPETTLDTTPDNPSTDDVAFTFSSNDGAASFECSLDGAAFAACTSPRSLTNLADGSHTFAVRAVDAVTGVDLTPATFTWTVDGTAPQTTIDTPPASPSNDANPQITFSANEAATFECAVDGGAFAACSSPLTLLGLAEGGHSLQVRATDLAGNVDTSPAVAAWVVDLTAPDTSIDSTPPLASTSSVATFTFSSPDPSATFECSLDGAAFTACASPRTLNNVTDGTHTFRVRAVDPAGNIDASPASYTWEIETVEPETFFVSTPNDPSNAADATFEFGSDETPVTFTCSLDSAPFAACSAVSTFAGLADGSHTLSVIATDDFGNVDPTPATYAWTIDTVAPQTGISVAPAAVTNDPDAAFAFTSTEANSTFECNLDGGGFSACPTPTTFAGLSDGAHTLSVRAIDAAGNIDATPATHAWTVDTVAPDTTLTSTPPDPASSSAGTFAFTSNESGSTFECAIDGGAFTACASPRTFTALADGEHTVQVRAVDSAGNVDATPAVYTWTVDTGAPQTTLLTTPTNPSDQSVATFDFDSDDVTATFECALDGAAFAVCTSPFTAPGLADGAHSFSVRAIDSAGNVDPTPATFAWTVDTTAPDTTIDAAPDLVSSSSDATFVFSSNEAGASFECSIDSSPFAACPSPSTFAGLSDGTHAFRVRAVDAAGNTDATPAEYTWEIDSQAPETFLDVAPADPSADEDATFVFSSDDGTATFECSLDGAVFVACPSPHIEAGLSDGPHTFRVRAVDGAGNVDATPATTTWTVDTGAPQTAIDSAPSDPSNAANPVFTFSADDSDATFECSLDGAAFAACNSPRTLVGLSEGAHTFRVRATDLAGNTDATPASYTWTVDLTAPTTSIDAQPDDPSNTADAVFAFSSDDAGATFECDLDGTGFIACDAAPTFAGLDDGAHVLLVRARDLAGNVDATPERAEWTIDTTAPETTIDAQPDDPSGSTSATFAFSADEGGATFECSLDGAAFSACASPLTFNGLAQGSHTFAVRAVDALGNVDATPAEYTWAVDTAFPETILDDAPGAFVNTPDVTFAFSSTIAGSTFECATDGGAFVACTSPQAFTGLAEGTYRFQVRAISPSSAVDPSPVDVTYTVDLTAPDAPTLEAPTGEVSSTTPAFEGTSEPFATVSIVVDGDVIGTTVADGTGAFSFTPSAPLALGDYSAVARATDRAGNEGPDSDAIEFTIVLDTDGDGLSDEDEATLGTDPNNPDTDDDSLRDGDEVALGTDPLDPDSDGDFIPDGLEAPGAAAVDTDLDGTIDALDLDSDADGVLDQDEGVVDSDGDGARDSIDDDDDQDGIPTRVEGVPFDPASGEFSDGARFGADVDGDGIPNFLDRDSDSDGIDDAAEGAGDSDSDGIPNYLDAIDDGPNADADSDGLTNAEELILGTNPFDADTDRDGVDDFEEVGDIADPRDTDNDGIIDALEADDDGDGILSRTEDRDGNRFGADLDGDSILPRVDLESDGDGIADATEGDADVDGDGIPNYLDSDSDGDGRDDIVEGEGDDDNDGTPNFLDPDDADGPDADADGDGLTNAQEAAVGTNPNSADSDEDGRSDFFEVGDLISPTDTDGDGRIDALDADDDGDGIPSRKEDADGDEFGADLDGDGIEPRLDQESDGDGLSDAIEGAGDVDSDGIPNYLDLDSDGDGKPDATEGAGDVDADGVPNFLDPDDNDGPDADADNDGLTNLTETRIGSNPNDADTDGDGIDDGTEVGPDPRNPLSTDNDGIPNVLDSDDDGDGLQTIDEREDAAVFGDADPDNDGIDSWLDIDADGDTLTDAVEGRGDVDDDGIPNYLDLNSDGDDRDDAVELDSDDDNDGIPNFLDADDTGGGEDADNDGIPNAVEVAIGTNPNNPDSDGDGVGDLAEVGDFADPTNTDGDSEIDALDDDDDNDGLLTLDEVLDANALGQNDLDGDGLPAWRDPDSDGDQIEDGVEGLGDVDNDGLPNYLDTDSDGDGDSDLTEGVRDRDCDGVPNFLDPDDATAPGCEGIDTDLDGVLDAVEFDLGTDPFDADSDDDGIDDGVETDGGQEIDTDSDGTIDALDSDSDGDGVLDVVEGLRDTNDDGELDFRDTDDDGDGIPTRRETAPAIPGEDEVTDGMRFGTDVDNDGIPNHRDRDSDGDGALDQDEGTDDSDLDGIPNYLDALEDGPAADPDGDGLTNAEEALAGTNPLNPDSDDDGQPDGDEVDDPSNPRDQDSDGRIDALDADDDDDGILSRDEVEDAARLVDIGLDPDNDGVPSPYDDDSDGDGISDATEGRADPDLDGIPAYLDLDSDGDGESDEDEGDGDDDEDGVPNFLDPVDDDGPGADADNDGLTNAEEAQLGTNPNRADTDDDGIDDLTEVGDINAPTDTDGDGLINARDPDDDGDGLSTRAERLAAEIAGLSEDFDLDGRPNHLDRDSDADGIFDGTEGAIDTDGDGAPNFLDADADGDGRLDVDEGIGDDDEDGIPNFLDPVDDDGPLADPDDDGLTNAEEVLVGTNPYNADSDGDGLLDGEEVGPNVNNPLNTDNDALPNALDSDDDGDGIETATEIADEEATGTLDADGVPAHLDLDSDGDGIEDAVEGVDDADNDGAPNYLDLDSDGDGIPDEEEGLADPDDDGVPAYLDDDSDGDGRTDAEEGNADDDGDDIPNFLDSNDDDGPQGDEDDDGLTNEREGQLGTDPLDPDSDDDGLTDGDEVDVYETDPNDDDSDDDGLTDGAEINDHQTDPNDADSDDGGVDDGTEIAAGTDPNDSTDDSTVPLDEDGDGITEGDNCEEVFNPSQADGDLDGVGDECDIDADGDGVPDDLAVYGGGCACDANNDVQPLTGWALLLGLALAGRALLRRRKKRNFRGGGFAAAVVAAGGVLLSTGAFAQVGGFNAERLRPAMDREGILDVESGEVGRHLSYDVALWGSYALNPVSLYSRGDGLFGTTKVGALVGHRVGVSAVGAISLFEWVEVGFELPVVALNLPGVLPDNTVSNIFPVGLGDARVSPKVRILRQQDHTVNLAVIPTITLPTGLPFDSYMGEGFFTFAPELALSRDFDFVRIAGNLGYRARPIHTLNNLVSGHEVFYRAGVAVGLDEWTQLPLEVQASLNGGVGVFPILSSISQSPLEAMGGVSYDLGDRLQFFGGVGVGILAGASVPDLRVFGGARYSPRPPLDSDGDGIPDDKDACPAEAEDKDGFEDSDGCPDLDNDQDQILDVDDACRDAAEDRDNFEDEDGCPDPDNDRDGIADNADLCRDEAEDVDSFEDKDGCPDPDNDGDGVLDADDKCPLVAGSLDYNGCGPTDADKDGIPDDKDVCKDEPEDKDGFQDEDGCPDLDNDGDGLPDTEDRCPTEAEDMDGFEDEDGCAEADNDKDGFLDAEDKCPNEAEVINGVKDDDGCPDKGKTLVIIEREKIQILDKVYFRTGRATIQARSFNLLRQVASIFRAHPELTKVRIEGHTDDVGREENNLKLSQRRADAVKAFLVETGVDAGRLDALGYGESRPVTPNISRSAREQNRRVEFRIVEVDGKPVEKTTTIEAEEKTVIEKPAETDAK